MGKIKNKQKIRLSDKGLLKSVNKRNKALKKAAAPVRKKTKDKNGTYE